MPRVIGVVTSPTGAVIRDIIHRIKDRFPLHVLVWPVRVQGETAGAEATAAVLGFNALAAGGADPAPGRADRGARRRQPRGSVGIQRRGAGARRRRVRHPGDLGGRPRDRLDADRSRGRHARADADRRGRNGRAGEGRAARPALANLPRAAQGLHRARHRPQAARRCVAPPARCPRPTSCWRCRAAASTRRPAGSAAR